MRVSFYYCHFVKRFDFLFLNIFYHENVKIHKHRKNTLMEPLKNFSPWLNNYQSFTKLSSSFSFPLSLSNFFSFYLLPLPTHSPLFTIFQRNSRCFLFIPTDLCVYAHSKKYTFFFFYITTILFRYMNGNHNSLVSAPSLLYSELPGCLKSDFL